MSIHPREAATRISEIDKQLMDPDVVSNQHVLKGISQERARLVPIVETWDALNKARSELSDTKELLEDPEMKEMAQEEYDLLVEDVDRLKKQLRMALI